MAGDVRQDVARGVNFLNFIWSPDVPRGQAGKGSRPVGTPGHRGVAARERDLARIAKLDRRGYTQSEIGRIIGISQMQVCDDLKLVRKHYRDIANVEYREKVEEKRAQLRDIRKAAWQAWERSKRDTLKVVEDEREGAGDGSPPPKGRKTTTVECRLPDAGYLRIIIETLRDECALDGLNQPQKLNVNANVIDWAELFRRTADHEVDQVEKRLAEIEHEVLAAGPPPKDAPATPGG